MKNYQPLVQRKISFVAHRIARNYVSMIRNSHKAWVLAGIEYAVDAYGIPMKLSSLMLQRSTHVDISEIFGNIVRTEARMAEIESIAKGAIVSYLIEQPELAVHLSALRAYEAERLLEADRKEQQEESARNAPLGRFLMDHSAATYC